MVNLELKDGNMKNKKLNINEAKFDYKTNMSPDQIADFEELYNKYHRYIYKYHVGYEHHFKKHEKWYSKNEFANDLEEQGLSIKIDYGY